MAKKEEGYASPLLWILGLGGIGVGVYLLLRRPGSTEAAPKPSVEPPSSYATLGAVATRIGEVGDLWRMGDLTPTATLNQLQDLEVAIEALLARGIGSEEGAGQLRHRIENLRQDVEDYLRLQQLA